MYVGRVRRTCLVSACVVAALLALISCGGTPTVPSPSPSPTPTPDPGPIVNNAPPVIIGFTVQGSRNNEPASFADLSEEVVVTANVVDNETPIGNLKFNWTASVGTFTGSGSKVTWKAPASATTPVLVTLNLEVVETYTSAGKSVDNKVTGSTPVSLHDSATEVGDMARQFLIDFSTSSLRDVTQIMRNFEPTCYGTADETSDVARNRTDFTIQAGWRVEAASTTVNFGSFCPFRNRPGDACAQVRTFWKSQANRDIFDSGGTLALHQGDVTTASGVDQVAAKYYKDQNRWRLCASDFNGDAVPQTSLRILSLRGLLP